MLNNWFKNLNRQNLNSLHSAKENTFGKHLIQQYKSKEHLKHDVALIHYGNFGSHIIDALANLSFPFDGCLLYTSPSPRDRTRSRMPSSA